VSTVKKSHATIAAAWDRRNVVHDSAFRPGCGIDPSGLEDRPHRRCRDGDAEPGEFTVNASVSPGRVLPRETDDQFAGLDDGGGSAGPVTMRPVVRDESAMPTQDRLRPDEEDGPTITTYGACERGEDHAIVGFETRTRDLALQHRELMTQHEDLDPLRTIASTAQDQEIDHEANKTVETGHTSMLAASEPDRSSRRVTPAQHARRVFGTHTLGRQTPCAGKKVMTGGDSYRHGLPADVFGPKSPIPRSRRRWTLDEDDKEARYAFDIRYRASSP
jgi:hypothetical protein